jgi:hypothetical protein
MENVVLVVYKVRFRVIVLNATFNNVSAILWQSVLLVGEPTDLAQFNDKLDHICCIEYTSLERDSNSQR